MLRAPLLILFAVLALVFSPAASADGRSADVPPAAGGHCEGGAPSDGQKSDMDLSCASACAALQAVLPSFTAATVMSAVAVEAALVAVLPGVFPRFEVPPPRA